MASGARMGLAVGFLEALDGDVGVDLGGGDAGVAEEFLDAAEIGAGVEHVSGEGVAELVGADVDGDAGVAEVFLEEFADADAGEACAALGDEEGSGLDAGLGAVALDGLEGRRADGDDALFAALAENADGLREGIDVGDVEADELREAEAAGVEELEDRGVAGGGPGGSLFFKGSLERGFEEFLDLGDGEDERELAFELGKLDFLEGVAGEAMALGEPLVEGAERGEMKADGGEGGAAFHELEEEAAEIVGGALLPRFGTGLGAEPVEGVAVIEEGAGRDVALEFEGIEEGVCEAVGRGPCGHGGMVACRGRWRKAKRAA